MSHTYPRSPRPRRSELRLHSPHQGRSRRRTLTFPRLPRYPPPLCLPLPLLGFTRNFLILLIIQGSQNVPAGFLVPPIRGTRIQFPGTYPILFILYGANLTGHVWGKGAGVGEDKPRQKRAASWQKRTMGKNKGKKVSSVSCACALSRAPALARPAVRPSSLRPSLPAFTLALVDRGRVTRGPRGSPPRRRQRTMTTKKLKM